MITLVDRIFDLRTMVNTPADELGDIDAGTAVISALCGSCSSNINGSTAIMRGVRT